MPRASYAGDHLGTVEDHTQRCRALHVQNLTDANRQALIDHDYVALFEMEAHFFLNLTMYIGIYDEPYMAKSGPLPFQREFAAKLQRWRDKDYPSVET